MTRYSIEQRKRKYIKEYGFCHSQEIDRTNTKNN